MDVFILGIVLGIIAGILPSMHPNTLIAILYPFFGKDSRFWQVIVGMLPAHLIFSLVPSVFFGIAQPQNALGGLPGQRLAHEGKGISALNAMLLACILSVLCTVVLFVPSFSFFTASYGAVRQYMGPILLIFSGILILRSKNPFSGVLVFVAAGILGLISFRSGMFDPFLPLFAGFFSLAGFFTKEASQKLPVQTQEEFPLQEVLFGVVIGFLGGMTSDIFAGISAPSQVATFASILVPIQGYTYLAATSSISASQLVFALATEHSIDKARVGGIEWLSRVVNIDDFLGQILMLMVISCAVSCTLVFVFRKRFASLATKDLGIVRNIMAIIIVVLTFSLDGVLGIIILGASSILGWICQREGVERTHLMGAIIIPTLLLLFRIFF